MSALAELTAAHKAAMSGDAREASYCAYKASRALRLTGDALPTLEVPKAKTLCELVAALHRLTVDTLSECLAGLENLEDGAKVPVVEVEQYANSWGDAARVAAQVAAKGYAAPGWSEPAQAAHAQAIWALIPTPALTPVEVTPGRVIAAMMRVLDDAGADVTRSNGTATVGGVQFPCPATWDGARELARRVDKRHPGHSTMLMSIDPRAALFHGTSYATANNHAYDVVKPFVGDDGRLWVLLRPLDGTRKIMQPVSKVLTCRAKAS